MDCPSGSHYGIVKGCPATCLEPAPKSCDIPDSEGCVCEKEFIMSEGKCVPKERCGCKTPEKSYIEVRVYELVYSFFSTFLDPISGGKH